MRKVNKAFKNTPFRFVRQCVDKHTNVEWFNCKGSTCSLSIHAAEADSYKPKSNKASWLSQTLRAFENQEKVR